jgi:hypothetical protein
MRFIRVGLCLTVLLTMAGMLFAQGTTGTILGTVTDSSGAVVPNAKVDVTNSATGVTISVKSTGSGDYTAPNLIPGPYRVSVEVPGFSKGVVSSIMLVVGQDARADVHLRPGAATETVEISANSVALDTDSAGVTQTVSEQQVSDLPLNGRNFVDLLFVGAGAVQTTGEMGQMRSGEGNAISIDGGRPESNNYTLDGLTNTDTALNTPAVILSQDAIQEFKVQSETYSAAYGFSANQVNMVSRSGANQYHGSVFEFDRNDYFDAINHQSISNTSSIATELRQNQFGYVLDGPLSIPKLYNGRDKSFFMANYEGGRIVNGGHLSGNAPTAAELGGDFSALASNPLFPVAGTPACSTLQTHTSGSNCLPVDPLTGAPFPDNKIPSSRFSNVANVMNKLIPTAATDSNGTTANNWQATANQIINIDQQTYRGDQNFGKWGQAFFRWTKADYASSGPTTDSLVQNAGANIFSETSTSWTLGYTTTLSKGFVNDFRFGKLEAVAIQGDSPATAADIATLNLSGTFTNLPSYAAGYPYITFGYPGTVTVGAPNNNPTTSDIPTWEYADSVSKEVGKHSFQFGIDFRSWVQKRNLATQFLGGFTYNSGLLYQYTNFNSANPATNQGGVDGCPAGNTTCATGNSIADYLLGYYDGATAFQPGPFTASGAAPGHLDEYVFRYVAPFFADDYKVTPKLTLNLGIRWDFCEVPYADDKPLAKFGTDQMFWLDDQNPLGGMCFSDQVLLTDGIAPAGNGFYRYCGQKPSSSSLTPFAPRFGFAYRPFDKMVVRGGYGIFFDSSETREMDDTGDFYPFEIRGSQTATLEPANLKLTNELFPPLSTPAPVSVANNGSAFAAVLLSDHPKNPYVEEWTLSVERELSRNTALDVFYAGNKGTHLLERYNENQPGPLSSAALPYCQANPTATLANGGQFNCTSLSRRPLPNFSATVLGVPAMLNSVWEGWSNYNAGNVKLEHRAKDGAVLLVYTWSKSLDDKSAAAGIGSSGGGFAGPDLSFNPRYDYGRSDFDVGQRFVASYAYMLPVGRGKMLGGSMNRAADAVAGGWELTGVATFQKGFPFSVADSALPGGTPLTAEFNPRANVTGNPNSGFHKSAKEWFNTSAFSQTAAGVYGNQGRNTLREPGINNWDMGVVKYVPIGDRVKFQMRLETFNTFNHAQFGVDPSATSSFGSGPGTAAEGTNLSTPGTFGQITSYRPARELQLSGKITF